MLRWVLSGLGLKFWLHQDYCVHRLSTKFQVLKNMLLSIIQCADGLAFTCKFLITLSIPMRSYERFVKHNRWQFKECKPLPLPLPSAVPEK